jgi:hypothetical protein
MNKISDNQTHNEISSYEDYLKKFLPKPNKPLNDIKKYVGSELAEQTLNKILEADNHEPR